MENSTNEIKYNDAMFEKAVNNIVIQDEFSRPSISFTKDVIRRISKNKLAMVSLALIVFIIIMTLIWPYVINYSEKYTTYLDGAANASKIQQYYAYQDYSVKNSGPTAQHWLGTDTSGRDLFARACQGGRVSLFIGFAAAFMSFVIGVTYGCFSGFVGGRVDMIMMRICEVLDSIPYMLMVILFSVILGSGLYSLILAISVTGWISMARLVRGQALQLKEQEYVQAARSFGAPTYWILFKHIVPNTMGPIIVMLTLTVPRAIFSEATLSFLGLGIQPPSPSWGQMASDSISQMLVGNYLTLLVSSILISVTMLAFNILGDGLTDALDPRLRK